MHCDSGCLVCGKELLYTEHTASRTCFYCGATKEAHASCSHGHYVCDACHNGKANDLIERCCVNAAPCSPLSLAVMLMNNPVVKLHGPEHHFLVPAVLLAAFYARTGADEGVAAEKIGEARKRAEDIKGGVCGFCGACGAAIGAGIFMSIITGATPLSDLERTRANLLTSECLRVIAEHGGPRCCKRETFWSIVTAVEFVRRELGVDLAAEDPAPCSFSSRNRECLAERCRFFRVLKEPALAAEPGNGKKQE